ncbi:HET-domain-containing protein [Stipitochalara longipes BDJ]|nr:HET-domain-containing protein [Stipitochalara longipes BDJ]
MSDSDHLRLCKLCEPFRDIDRVTSSEPIIHHKSWTELCRCAKESCQLCQAFVRGQAQKHVSVAVKDDFDKEKDFPATQLTWQPNTASGPYILRQQGLFFHPHRDVVNLWVDLFTTHDDALASLILERPINEYSNSQACFDMIAKWILECKNDHPGCSWSNDCILPTRLIDVGDSPSSTPRLVATNGVARAWLTLSHCWGGQLPLATTLETLEERMEGISMDRLPPTFRDAIEITRKLGFRYIWIDTFCIIQDSRQDWGIESTKMHEIYANASLCIAASAAPNAEAGIFASADRERHISRPLISFPSSSHSNNLKGTVSLRPQMSSFPYTMMHHEHLHRRAWALQENILAQRTLNFASSQIHWNCRSRSYSERIPSGPQHISPMPSDRDLYAIPLERLKPHPNIRGYPLVGSQKHPMEWWYMTLWNYTLRSITVHNDLIPAIGGIAQKVAERSGYHYHAGLWQEDFHRGLLWQAFNTVKKAPNTSSPSWSWASTEFPWEYHPRKLHLDTYIPGKKAKILELTTTTNTGNPYAQISTSCLRIEGLCRPLNYWTNENAPIYNNERWLDDMQIAHRWLFDEHGAIPLKIPPPGRVVCTLDERPKNCDTCHQEVADSKAIALQIASFRHESRRSISPEHKTFGSTAFALILQPTEKHEEYQRIGIAEIPTDDGMADGWDTKIITIV